MINVQQNLAASVGTLDAIDVHQPEDGELVRYHRLTVEGQCDVGGIFELTIPSANGHLRAMWIAEKSGFAMGSAVCEVEPVYDALVRTQGLVAVMASGKGFAAFPEESAAGGESSLACGPVKIRIRTATASGKFVLVLVVKD